MNVRSIRPGTAGIDGVVLAGGHSSRMRSAAHAPCDKAWLLLADLPLIEHAARSLGGQVRTLYVSTPLADERYRALGLPVPDEPDEPDASGAPGAPDAPETPDAPDAPDAPDTPDTPDTPDETLNSRTPPAHTRERRGPLAGVLAAMRVSTAEWLAVAPCDAPFLPEGWVMRLVQAAREAGAPAAVVVHRGWRQPVCMVVRGDLQPRLQAALSSGVRKVGQWQREVGAIEVAFDAAADHAFLNINTPDDLAQAQALMVRHKR